jgi:hypothetical protein
MNYPEAPLLAVIVFVAFVAAVVVRFGIRSYFREKRAHLRTLMSEPQDTDPNKKEN